MSDDSTKAIEPPATPAAEKRIENPMATWMRGGGTRTSAYEAELAKQKQASAQARAIEDARRKKAEDGSDEAKQYRHVMGGNKAFPGIVLEFKHPKDNVVLDYISCELSAAEDGSLILVMACIWCYHRTGDASNITIRQSHRRFELDTRRQGEIWVNPKNPQDIVTLAGTIHLTERVTCPGCAKQFRIDDSVVREV